MSGLFWNRTGSELTLDLLLTEALIGTPGWGLILSRPARRKVAASMPHSSRGLGHSPLKAEIIGSNPICGTTLQHSDAPEPRPGGVLHFGGVSRARRWALLAFPRSRTVDG